MRKVVPDSCDTQHGFAGVIRGLRAILIVAAALASASVACQAQSVYSVGVYSMGQTYEHDWTIGVGTMHFGFEQYRQCQDANGKNLHSFSKVSAEGAAWPRYTTVHFGSLCFSLRGPAWLYATLLAVASLLLFAIGAGSRSRQAGSLRVGR
jgi:hypothetical protein